ncbi:hypothetical protein OG389_16105 [Streptomyces sp. NBC_00435]|uniref:hypothetical protein n=1 Tax=Streptomyces sp. NBC_00435 TaxID=2903649 RepID=UPI002E1DE7D3
MNPPPEGMSVHPGPRRVAGCLLVPFALLLWPKLFLMGGGAAPWILGGLSLALLLAVPFLCRLISVTVAGEVVTVRHGPQRISIPADRLAEVAVTGTGGRLPLWTLSLTGTDGVRAQSALTFTTTADRRRLLAALEGLAAPGVVRHDEALRRMLGEGRP